MKKTISYKRGIIERIDSNNIPKTIDEQVEDFMVLPVCDKIDWMKNYGNETWKLAKELAKRKALLTKCRNKWFEWEENQD